MIDSINNFPLFAGVLAAVIHVLSGPDHLAAVGPIVLQKKSKSWVIGFTWGIGHIAGMAVIGILFFYFRNFIPVKLISQQSEKLVGLILIIIGVWVFYKLVYKKKKGKHSHIHVHHDKSGKVYAHYHPHEHTEFTNHDHLHPVKQSIAVVFGIGTLHGLAGISHLISLLPTLAFSNSVSAVMYLGGFAIGTILGMVFFSIVLELISLKIMNRSQSKPYEYLNAFAATIAILIGLFWIYHSM